MAHLIDKNALVAEIKKQIGFIPECVNAFDEGEEHAYSQILSFLNTIEVKEVNIEKEFRSFLDDIEGMPRMWHSDEQLEWDNIYINFIEI